MQLKMNELLQLMLQLIFQNNIDKLHSIKDNAKYCFVYIIKSGLLLMMQIQTQK